MPFLYPNLSKELSDLLFGPLYTWIPNHARMSSIPIYEAAAAKSAVSWKVGSVQHAVGLRMWFCYLLLGEVDAPPAASLPYHIGLWIDLHMKCLDHDTSHAIFLHRAAPEQRFLSTVLNDECQFMLIGMVDVESLWAWYTTSSSECNIYVPWMPLDIPYACILKRSAGKPTDPRSEYPSIPYHGDTQQQRKLDLMSVIKHCAMGPKQAKHIKKAVVNMGCSPSVQNVVHRGILGVHHSATVIADPGTRRCVYTNQIEIEKIVPMAITAILSEYVLSVTRHHPVLWSVLMDDPCTRDHITRVGLAANAEYRVVGKVTTRLDCYNGYTNIPSPARFIDILCELLDVSELSYPSTKRSGVLRIGVIAAGSVPLVDINAAVNAFRGDLRVYDGILAMLGVSTADRDLIKDFSQCTLSHNEAFVSSLSPAGKSKLAYYVWLIVRQSHIGWVPLARKIDTPAVVLICLRCNEVVSECVRRQASGRRTILDMHNRTVMCSHCHYVGMRIVPLSTFMVHCRSDTTGRRAVITACTRCKCHTNYLPEFVVGTNTYCHKCYMLNADAAILNRCVCGISIDSPAATHGQLTALVAGESKTFLVCRTHAALISKLPSGHPIEWYWALCSI